MKRDFSKWTIIGIIVIFMMMFGVSTSYKCQRNEIKVINDTLIINTEVLKDSNNILNHYKDSLIQRIIYLTDTIKHIDTIYQTEIKTIKSRNYRLKRDLDQTQDLLTTTAHALDSLSQTIDMNIVRFDVSSKVRSSEEINFNKNNEFTVDIHPNPLTRISVSSKHVNGKDSLSHELDIHAAYEGSFEEDLIWEESNFIKRLVLFRWKKISVIKNEKLKTNNDVIKIDNFIIKKVTNE